ncbi:hypothetical protein CGA22_23785 [Pseudomonas sp. PSB18]|nr:hypothetical protein [Pseudomonas sp. PSB18]
MTMLKKVMQTKRQRKHRCNRQKVMRVKVTSSFLVLALNRKILSGLLPAVQFQFWRSCTAVKWRNLK